MRTLASNSNICRSCGKSNPPEAAFCMYCAAALSPVGAPSVEEGECEADTAGEERDAGAHHRARALFAIGKEAMDEGAYKKAQRYLKRATAQDPDLLPAWNYRALAYLRMDKFFKAIKCFNRVLDEDPTDEIAIEGKQLSMRKIEEEETDAI